MKVEENAVLKDIKLSAAMKKTARNIAWRMYKSRGPKKKKILQRALYTASHKEYNIYLSCHHPSFDS